MQCGHGINRTQALEQRACAVGQHALGQPAAQSTRIIGAPRQRPPAPASRPVRPPGRRGSADCRRAVHRPRWATGSCRRAAQRRRAPHPWRAAWPHDRAGHKALRVCIRAAALDADHALGDRGQANVRIEPRGDARLPTQSHQPGAGQHDSVHTPGIELAQSCIHIAAQRLNAQIHAQPQSCACRRRLDVPTTAQCGRSSMRDARCGDQRIARVRALDQRRIIRPAGRSAGTSFIE